MAVSKLQVFLASRFEEFQDLRRTLKRQLNDIKNPPVEVVDLNDNLVDPHPPLERCYQAVTDSDLFVLLVGDTYGGSPKGKKESYTHLEHRRALNEGKIILPFVIGQGYVPKPEFRQIENDALKKWLAEIEDRHTPGYFDLASGLDYLAGAIVQRIRDHLGESFLDDDISEPDGVDDEIPIGLEPIIKRAQLFTAPQMSAEELQSRQPLKMLARNHSKEALRALDLGFRNIAIHHLRQAVQLVPLDVVLGYWLARLLVASGGRRACEKGKRTALRCSKVSAAEENENELETMACLLLVARASERLDDLEGAREFARKANEKAPYHWLAKVEYARQLALAGDQVGALKLAKEAFWLQPHSIARVQKDPAFRGLGNSFADFRVELRQTVTDEVREIFRVEGLIREFAYRLGISQPVAPQVHEFADSINDQSHTLNRLIQRGQLSLKSSLQILQQSAIRLSTDNNGFSFNSDNGLTPATKLRIEEAVRTEQCKVTELGAQRSEELRKAKHLSDQQTAIAIGGGLGSVAFFAIAIIALYAGAAAIGVVLIVIIVLGLLITWTWYQSFGTTHSKTLRTIKQNDYELLRLKNGLTEVQTILNNFNARQSQLLVNTATFCKLVDQFETRGLKRVAFELAPPVDRKGAEGMVRTDSVKASSLGLEIDDQLLPIELRFLSESSSPKSKYWLARRHRANATERLSRSLAYFYKIQVNTIYLYKNGSQSGPFPIAHVRAWLKAGRVKETDQAWYEGASEWMPLSSVLDFIEY
jgi:tetratricopeptide (TPR) repeat protein